MDLEQKMFGTVSPKPIKFGKSKKKSPKMKIPKLKPAKMAKPLKLKTPKKMK